MNRFFLIYAKFVLAIFVLSSQVHASDLGLQRQTFNGVAPITANLDNATYSSRAFNDAVRQLMSQAGVKIGSFTLIENGKVLIDQIQSKSNLVVHEYQIVDESRDDKIYQVKVNFLYSEGTQNAPTSRCLKIPTYNIETNLTLQNNRNVLPWAHLSATEISDQLSDLSFSPNVKFSTNSSDTGQTNNLYTLTKKQNKVAKYSVNVKIKYEQRLIKSILSNNHLITVTVDIETYKFDELLLNDTYQNEFLVDRKAVGNISFLKNRNNWDQTKAAIYSDITAFISQHVNTLECLKIAPNLELTNGRIKLNYGREEGIKLNDLIVTRNDTGQQIFLKVTQANKHEAFLTPVSNVKNLSSINLKRVAILNGT